jgi:hemerythrin-like domain-containing protein
MTEIQTECRPDTTDLIAVHRVFRDALANAAQLIEGAKSGDDHRATLVGSYYDNIMRFLKVHHEAEDDLVWPKLLDRSPARAALVKDLISDHEQIHESMEQAETEIARWTASADPTDAREVTSALTRLGAALIPHLDREDEEIVPLCSEYLSAEEWGEMPGHALHSFDGDKVWLILGLIRENMTQAQRDAMLAHMPPPARDMWVNMGNAAFDEFIAEVRNR